MKKCLSYIILLLAFGLLAACSNADPKIAPTQAVDEIKSEVETMEIDDLYICHYHIFRPCIEYKLDFVNQTFWSYNGLNGTKFAQRDHSLANEGFGFVKDLDGKAIEDFWAQAEKLGLNEWGESYIDSEMEGGHQWSMTITYSDGSRKQISGSNQYPENWAEMNAALESLTGESLLILKTTAN